METYVDSSIPIILCYLFKRMNDVMFLSIILGIIISMGVLLLGIMS